MKEKDRETRKISPTEIKQYIRRYIEKHAMGLLDILNLYIKTKYKTDAVTLFLSKPKELTNILRRMYDDASATLIIRMFFLKPLLIVTNNLDKMEYIDNILANRKGNLDQLYIIIKEIMEKAYDENQ